MSKYAENTTVSSDRSRTEIEKTLQRYGTSKFMYGWEGEAALIAFEMEHRRVKFVLPLPDRDDKEFTHTPGRGSKRNPKQIEAAYEQAVKQKWRALALVIKAKLEAVESGITVFEDELLAHIVLPNGETVGPYMRPQIKNAYDTRNKPQLLQMD